MVLEENLLPYFQWLLTGSGTGMGALLQFVLTMVALALLATLGGFLIAMVRYGPIKAGDLTYRVLSNGFFELLRISPRRIWALARLAVKESLRRRVVVALVVFLIVLLFAGLFLKSSYQEPSKLFLEFVLTAMTYLLLMIALLLSAFSLPNDFKSKTIYTVVTKPVRAGDIVLGRILGFTLIGTVLLVIMATCSYVFVNQSLDHSHELDFESVINVVDADGVTIGRKGRTTLNQYHRHEVEINDAGAGVAYSNYGHEHGVTLHAGDTVADARITAPIGYMRARVPYYGKLHYLDRKGFRVAKGVSVGSEWTYRSYIAGGTSAAAIWVFEGIDESRLRTAEDGSEFLPIELIVRVFRTYQGNIEQGIQGSLQLRNPEQISTEEGEVFLKSNPEIFTAKDKSINQFYIPRKLFDTDQNQIDLLEDLVSSDGRLEVVVQCLERAQYFGFAQPDCYIQMPEASPLLNFIKAQISIWIQMVLVISIGVACSTLVNGPVAMLFTVSFITLGFFREFFVKVATGEQVGGGPVESLVRLVTQKNMVTPLEDGFGTSLIEAIDSVLQVAMVSLASVLPDFRSFSTVDYVSQGFNIPLNQVAQHLTVGAAYVIGLSIVGYFFLRTREVAK